MICPVVAYAPTSATKPIIAQRPLTVIELLIYVTILYSKYKILSNNLTIEFVVISEQSLKILICCINFTYLQSLVAEFRSMD